MPLSLLAGPANAGKVALLLDRYLGSLESDPILIVPNRPDVDRAERELLTRTGALVGGSIGTFDDLFERIARGNGAHRPVVSEAQRSLLLRRVVARAADGLGPSARFGGFADALGTTVAELESALLEPGELDGELAQLYGAYREELARLGLWDRELERRHAAERVGGDLDAWSPRPVFAYGFEDLTGSEWALLEALAARADVTVSLPYEPGRDAFASLSRTSDDLNALAANREELPANPGARPAALAHVERALFGEQADPPELDGSIRFLEGAGLRGTLELVAEEVLALLRSGTEAGEIAIVCPSLERWRAPLDTAFTTLGVPYALEGRLRLGQTPFGQALLALLRYAWLDGERRDLFAFLRSPYSGLARHHVDFLEGRLRGRGVTVAARVEEEVAKLRGQPLPHLEAVRSAADPLAAVKELARAMARAAYGLESPPTSGPARLDLRAHEKVARLVAELEGWRDLGGEVTREEAFALLDNAPVRLASAGEAGRVAVLDLLRARTRRFEVVFILGLEEGHLPRRAQGSPFLDEEQKAELERSSRSGRLLRTDPVSRDRYLFYTACTRPTRRLYLVREAASDEGSPRESSPFWDEVHDLFAADEIERWTKRRPLAALTWQLEAAPSERERLRALASLASSDRLPASALARANGWERRLERALGAFDRPTRLTHPAVLEELHQKASFSVTDLERFADCSSMWLFERVVSPRSIDAEVDARLRGTVAHQALSSFFKGLPKRTGAERVQPENLDDALVFLRECLADAMKAHVRVDVPELERRELEQSLMRDLDELVRREAESESPLVPDRFEVSFGSERSAPELQRGLDLGGFTVSGKIDRIDRDPFGARGIVVDYKSGRTAHSAAEIERAHLLQIPLYMLVLRDLVGIEPLGGVYRALAGDGKARGLLRAELREDGVPGFQKNDYLDEDAFWGQVEGAQERARTAVARIREGDVKHDPKGGFPCPTWCSLWICRVRRHETHPIGVGRTGGRGMPVSAPVVNPEQAAAIEEPGVVFVSAGAGTGKTTVIVERFCRAVCERGLDVDSILVITYTERAAGELRGRIRRRLHELERHDLARDLDAAWISTIHGFCHRLLKAHPFAAGIDPRFRVLDDSQGRVLRGEAFREALEEFCKGGDEERLRLLASYGAKRLRRMLTGVHETLRSSGLDLQLEAPGDPQLEARIEELRTAARALQSEQAAQALRLLEPSPSPETLLDLAELSDRSEAAEAYEEARLAVEQAALEALAARDREQLQELLLAYDRAYRAAKDRESALDFEDLQLLARELLRENEEIRERESWRFKSIMVDEFQDTNRLQCELVDLLAREDAELFFVGDEFQSIYRFRHADVEVFRERREQVGGVLALTQNYRSRPEVLDVINHLFAADFGETFQPLDAAGRFSDPAFGAAVELLVTDKASYAETGTHWRQAEARHIAARVRDLVDTGEAAPGEIVLLFAAGTDARLYEEELRALGLPTFRATGRDYYHQQQVVDLLAYLRLLHNRYDDEALVTVLASPFVGASNDALVLLRRAAPKRPLFAGLEKGMPEGLSATDLRLFEAFKQRFDRLAVQAPALSLERLCEQIVCAHDYDLAVLAQWDGRRRYANLRKLARLARSYEELRGPDVQGFVRFVAEQDAVGASELEAVAEEEGTDVIRLLTIHSAKGLEFKVVVVADAGRDRGRHDADEILCLPDGRLGFRVAEPSTGKRLSTSEYESVKTAEQDAEGAERLRLYYVAMTRAIDRLIVSGAIDQDRKADANTPIGWVLDRLDANELDEAGDSPVEIERGGARLLIRLDRHSPEAAVEPPPAVVEQLELFEVTENGDAPAEPAVALAPLAEVPAPPLHRVRRLSYSALSLFERCSYRYFAERVVGLRPADASGSVPGQTGLAATEIGDAVHGLLERIDLSAPSVPGDLSELVRARYPAATDEELERIRAFVASYCGSELGARIAALEGAAPELPFAFEHEGVLLHGRIDVLHREGTSALVLDYKTNSLAEGTPEEIVEHDYNLQRLVYALACFRAGAEQVEVVYHFLERRDAVVATSFTREDIPALEAELSAAIAQIQANDFRPTPDEFVCADCPALNLVCAGPRLRHIA